MRVNKLLTGLLIAVAGCFILMSAYASTQQPVAMLQGIANNMISGLKSHKANLKNQPQVVYSLAQRYVVPNADLDQMSQRVLPRATWNSASAAQRAQFKKEFTRTLIRTYASALSSYDDQVVSFSPVRGGEGEGILTVNSQIQGSQGDPINVSYQVMRVGGAWKLIDLSVEGVDMLDSFRAQFADILESGNMDILLQRMSAHNNRA